MVHHGLLAIYEKWLSLNAKLELWQKYLEDKDLINGKMKRHYRKYNSNGNGNEHEALVKINSQKIPYHILGFRNGDVLWGYTEPKFNRDETETCFRGIPKQKKSIRMQSIMKF